MINIKKISNRKKRHLHIRKNIHGTSMIPRLNVFRSNRKIFAQIIDDDKKITLASVSSNELGKDNVKNNQDNAQKLGNLLADKAKKINITTVVFDRGGYAFHGKIAAFAKGCKEKGLKF